MKQQIRQGDVLFVKAEKVSGEKLSHTIVAEGEATGHYHKLIGLATLYQDGLRMFAEVGIGVVLTHQEHAAIPIAPGIYEIRRQREYHPRAIRNVMD